MFQQYKDGSGRSVVSQPEAYWIAVRGMSMPSAAATIGVTRQAIYGALHRYDLHSLWKGTRQKLKDAKKSSEERICQECGKEIPTGKRYRYCGSSCKNRVNNRKKLAKRAETLI